LYAFVNDLVNSNKKKSDINKVITIAIKSEYWLFKCIFYEEYFISISGRYKNRHIEIKDNFHPGKQQQTKMTRQRPLLAQRNTAVFFSFLF